METQAQLSVFIPKISTRTSCSMKVVREVHRTTRVRRRQVAKWGSGSAMTKDLSLVLRTEAAIRNIERKANSDKYNKLWPKAVLEALHDAIKNNSWETALKIFRLLRMQHWYEPRLQTYTKLLMMLGKCKRSKQAGILFEVMLSDGLKPTVALYTALVNAYGQTGLLDKAFLIVDEMKSVSDCVPDVYTYTILLNCCTKHHRFDLTKRILDEMSYFGIECSNVTYNTLIHAYGKAEMFDLMENLLNDMIESDTCRPDLFTMNSFVGALGNYGRIDAMEKWYDEFQLMGLKPDMKTFNILIKSYGKARMYEKMNLVMSFMEERFFAPNIVTFNIVIEIYGKAGDITSMEKYYSKMKHRGLKPNSITYCSLASSFGKAGLTEKVNSIVRQVENSDVVLDTLLFNSLIGAYGRAGNIRKMSQVFLAMRERKCCPDNVTFATMIRAFEAKGMREVAQDMEKVMNSTKDYSEILKFLPS